MGEGEGQGEELEAELVIWAEFQNLYLNPEFRLYKFQSCKNLTLLFQTSYHYCVSHYFQILMLMTSDDRILDFL